MVPSKQKDVIVIEDDDFVMADSYNKVEALRIPTLLASHQPSAAAVWLSNPGQNLGSISMPIELDDDDRSTPRTSISSTKARTSSTSCSSQTIEVDLTEDENDFIEIFGDRKPQYKRTPTPIKYEYRNPPIIEPLTSCENYNYNNSQLRPSKTVELKDGDFLRISHIIRNTSTSETKLRGHRLQRTRDLNGMLEKKLNEVCLCLEVDLDDPREPQEQGAIEVPIDQVFRLRNLRFTNQRFPQCRNVAISDFTDQDKAAAEGGLTARWKSTCTYASAADRHENIHKERTLEHIRADEATRLCAVSDDRRRFDWRGETVPGGAYQPAIGEYETIDVPEEGPSNPHGIHGKSSVPELGINRFCSAEPKPQHKSPSDRMSTASHTEKKRKHSSFVTSYSNARKRAQLIAKSQIEDTRRKLSVVILDHHESKPKSSSTPIDTSQTSHPTPSPTTQPSLSSSPLSTPPPTGSLPPLTSPTPPMRRSPNQKLTYGDAFCGAGGTTRGALQAGLHIKWGFDFNPTACHTWRSNFPSSRCFCLPSHDFVSLASSSPDKDNMKVDILHLSPPCQFFSPAHTRQGPDDEMNTASLFAVQSIIEVTRPRVVTLEQTFGITGVRFRGFFNALVQMFTVLGFSVRWAVVGLAQWGLPQRRNRLIIIASCPGEPLPRMPPPTHGPGLLPFVSVSDTTSHIPFNAPDHDLNGARFALQRCETPWDGNRILPRTMTTHGGNYHPSGERGFTVREYAALQGFPLEHVFEGSGRKKQIGNAVPPVVARVLFESVKKDLDRVDGVVGEEAVVID